MIKYRPDVDGLRALAILPVILYHAKLGCPGGFVGVDVFFVISGFVIYSLILRELADGGFSLVNFWERRVRRILPALTVVVLATLITAYFLFLPGDFAFVGRSVAAQAVLGANFFFWKQPAGYFAFGTETEPLLHTWSLAVEEQFYLLFPPLLVLLMRFRKKSLLPGIVTLAVLSFALSVAGSYSKHNLSSTFFLLPARAWELMLGALLAVLQGRISAGGAVRESAGWLGLALIGWPVFCYSTATRFPGLAAFPPCLGAALIIFSSESKLSSVGRALSFRPLVFTGLVSYPLYLWHWPLLAFTVYLSKDTPGTALLIGILAASFVLACLSWQFIEKPFRRRQIFRQRMQIFGFAGATAATLLALGLVVNRREGFAGRFPATVMSYANANSHNAYLDAADMELPWARHLTRFSTTKINPPVDVVVWGDSHAMMLTPVIDMLCRQYSWQDMEATYPGTPPVLGSFQVKGHRAVPADFSSGVMKYLGQHRPRAVVLAGKWSGYTWSETTKSNLVATVRAALDLGVQVYVVKDVPIPGYNVPRFAALAVMHGEDVNTLGETPDNYRQANTELQPTFNQLAQLGATVLDPAPYFLNGNGLYGVEKDGKILYYDTDHMSEEGALRLVPLFEPIFTPHESKIPRDQNSRLVSGRAIP